MRYVAHTLPWYGQICTDTYVKQNIIKNKSIFNTGYSNQIKAIKGISNI